MPYTCILLLYNKNGLLAPLFEILLKFAFLALLDDLDKELNNYVMRCREWYGWHFPEMGKVISDHTAYARVIKLMGFRTEAQATDFSEILAEDIATEVV